MESKTGNGVKDNLIQKKPMKFENKATPADPRNYTSIIISASDIERYGYCPLSWWIKFKGTKVTDEKLESGTQKHKSFIKKVTTVKERQKSSTIYEFNIKIFALIASILAINGIAILLPLYFVRNLMIYISVIWIVIALVYFGYSVYQVKIPAHKKSLSTIESSINPPQEGNQLAITSTKSSSSSHTRAQKWKRSALWFLIIAGGLAFNGIAFLQPSSEIMSRIYLISALLWLIGTMVILYYVLRLEAKKKKEFGKFIANGEKTSMHKMGESEKLIIGFAVVAALLAINGLTIQHRQSLIRFEVLGQIIMLLAALWLGLSFVFLYISFQGRIVTSGIARDIDQAPTESKKYKVVVEKVKSFALPERILSYNWPMLLTLVAVILGINSIMIRYGTVAIGDFSEILSRFLVVISLLWLLAAFIFLYNVLKNTELAEEIRRLHGIYQGKIEYTDKLDRKSKLLYSKEFGIRGKPDYIVKIKGKYIPVEVKTGKIPKGPHFSHIIQIAAYCLLISENYKVKSPYGIISYSKENKHKIDFDTKLEKLLVEKIAEMRQCIKNNNAHRNHNRVGKCNYCSRRKDCPERLG